MTTMSFAVVHQFDQPFARVARRLPRLQQLGFSHVLVSPPQKSHPSRRWWGRYQPVDFRRIEGPLGDAGDLARLCRLAARRGMRVAADAVLNHTTNHPGYVQMRRGQVTESRLPQFSAWDFHAPEGRPPVSGGAPLPQLRTDTPYVQGQLRAYLHGLYRLGVRGFRFDAAKHMCPSFFPYALHDLPGVLAFGEMVYADARHYPPEVLGAIQGMDFPLVRTIAASFAPGGDLGRLVAPEQDGGALWGPVSISFVNGHDLARRRAAFRQFRLADPRDRELAHVFLLGRSDGTPLVYYTDLRSRLVKAALAFRQHAGAAPMRWVLARRGAVAFTRGRRALAAINKTGHPLRAPALSAGLAPGVYRDLTGGWHRVDGAGRWRDAVVPARGAALLVHVASG